MKKYWWLFLIAGIAFLAGCILLGAAAFFLGSRAQAQITESTPEMVVEEPAEESVENECPQAADLGPWAPNVDGSGENFEVTCNETVCNGTHVQLWWPGGSGQPWGTKEISVFIPAGLSIEVQKGAGRGWEYSLGCASEEIQKQILADNARRKTDTAFYGQIAIDDLIKTGLVVVRFDRRTP